MLILSHGKVTMKKCYNMVEITPAGRNYPVVRYACSTGSDHDLMMEGQVNFGKYRISHMKK